MTVRSLMLALAASGVAVMSSAEDLALPFEVADLSASGQAAPVLTDLRGSLALIGHRMPNGHQVVVHRRSAAGVWNPDAALTSGVITDLTLNPSFGNEAAVVRNGAVGFFSSSSPGTWLAMVSSPAIPSGERARRMSLEGNRLVVTTLDEDFDLASRARVYERTNGIWNSAGSMQLPVLPGGFLIGSPEIQAVALSGTTVAIAGGSGQVNLHERNTGGPGAWGMVRAMNAEALGFAGFGESIAMSGNRLAVVARESGGRLGVEVFVKDTAGVNAWGDEGRLFTAPPGIGLLTLHTDSVRLLVVGYELQAGMLGTEPIPVRAWWFAGGDGPGGWALEKAREVGALQPLSAAFSGFQNTPRLAGISGDDTIFGHAGLGYDGAAGWACVFHRRDLGGPEEWGFLQRNEGPGWPEAFGKTMDFMDGLLAVGMPDDSWLGPETGSVMLWRLVPTGTGNGQLLMPLGRVESPSPQAGERFGASVSVHNGAGMGAIGGAMLAVGAPGRDANRGAAYVFDLGPGGVGPGRSLSPVGPLLAGDRYGSAVAVRGFGDTVPSGDSMVAVGAPGDFGVGAVFLYERDFSGIGGWGYRKKISRPASVEGTNFGSRVVLLGSGGSTTLFANRPPSGGNAGRIGVFLRNEGGASQWGLRSLILAPAGAPGGFASSIHGSAQTLAVGAPSTGGGHGMAFLYSNHGGAWEPFYTATGTAADGPSFGSEVAASLYWLAVGAPNAASGNGSFAFFGLHGTAVSDWGRLITRNGTPGENLGRAVAASWIYGAGGAPGSNFHSAGGGRVMIDRAGSYEVWAKAQGETMLAAWLPWQDADGDGQSNLAEFALGSNPTHPGSIGRHPFQRSTFNPGTGARPSMAWRRESPVYYHTFLDWRVDASPDLINWNLGEFHPVADGTAQIRHFLLPVPTPPRYFYRLNPRYPWFAGEQGSLHPGGGLVLD